MKKQVRMNFGMPEELPEEIARKLEVGRYILAQDIDRFQDGSEMGFRYINVEYVWEESEIPDQIVITREQMDKLLAYMAKTAKIQAIKDFREIMDMNCRARPGLKEAKDYIENIFYKQFGD